MSPVLSETSLEPVLRVDNSSANVATVAAPVEVTLKSSFVPLSPPMTPEDLQTIVIPDDLFHYEPSQPSSQDAMVVRATPLSLERSAAMQSRRTTRAVPQPPATPSPSIPSDELSHHGNGVPCRYFGLGKKGCKQGNQCMFSHMLVPSRPGHSGRFTFVQNVMQDCLHLSDQVLLESSVTETYVM